MRIAVFGAGGVGGYFGGRLAEAGEEVIFVARGSHLEAMKTSGLEVASIHGDFQIDPVAATDEPESVGVADVVLVATKAWQVPEAAQAIRPMVGPETVIVPLQNGVDAPAQLLEVFDPGQVAGGLCGLISYIEKPGRIRHAGALPFIQFGELDNRPSQRLARLQEAFAAATGLRVEVPDDIHVAVWRKFLLIVSWSGVGAITRAPINVVLSIPETRAFIQEVMEEVAAVARGHDIELPDNIVGLTFGFLENLPPGNTASMQRDVMDGRPSELESQTGAVVRLGREVDIPTPLNDIIYRSLLPQEMAARGT